MLLSRFICLILICVVGIAQAATNKEAKDLHQLVKKLEKIQSISGEFVQISIDQKGVLIQESRGEFKAQRPGQFYWYTKEPLEQGIYANGAQVAIYDPDLEQATIQKASDEIQKTPAVLFSGDVDQIGQNFDVEMRKFDDVVTQFILVPKSNESLFERMKIKFEGGHVSEMNLSDSLGQTNTVSFIHTQINETFPESAFSPEFPEGTDIIRDLPGELAP